MTPLEKYYGKFHEENRLQTRHGQVEFATSMHFITQCIGDRQQVKIADIGAGTGRYSVALKEAGHDVTAVELVKHNLEILESKHTGVKCWQGDARNLSFLKEESFDITLLFGPQYHLLKEADRLQALKEAKRITKKEGRIFVAYCMNDYSVLTWCFKERHILECVEKGTLSPDFKGIPQENDLYAYLRLEDIDALNSAAGLRREYIFAPDGAADYMRRELNALTPEEFEQFLKYQLAVCRRPELLGASSHVVDVLIP